ncbi:MAG: molybdopterin molybdotransferase MoeA [Pseudomonadota bacterium]
MMKIPFTKALEIILKTVSPLPSRMVSVDECAGRVVAARIASAIDSPSAHVSLKDGYAVVAADLAHASEQSPVSLRLAGAQFAGNDTGLAITAGEAARITTGAVIPQGADAVLAEEFATAQGNAIMARAAAAAGRNILPKSTDLEKGKVILPAGAAITPARAGLIAAAGLHQVDVHQSPRIAIIAIGDEIVPAGEPVSEGKVAASNLVSLRAWCESFNMQAEAAHAGDTAEDIAAAVSRGIRSSDCIITSGGAWKSERDFVVGVLDGLGWKKMFHRVKLGPGKAMAFGMLGARPVFCLPGGPPSNQVAFLMLALPGLLRLGGHSRCALPSVPAVLERSVSGLKEWTQVKMGLLNKGKDGLVFSPLELPSRLMSLAKAQALMTIPEGVETVDAGSKICAQMLAFHGL